MSLVLLGILNSQAAAGASAAAFDHIETIDVSGGPTSITFSGLDSLTDYKHLQIRYTARDTNTSTISRHYITLNGDTSSVYNFHWLYGSGSSASGSYTTPYPRVQFYGDIASSQYDNNRFVPGVLDLYDFLDTNKWKSFKMKWGMNGGTYQQVGFGQGTWASTSAVSSITFQPTSGVLQTYSSYKLYGIRG